MGFFESVETPIKKSKSESGCQACKKFLASQHRFSYVGGGARKILVVGSAPTSLEDDLGILGKNPDIRFLKRTFSELGFDFDRDCWYTTTINCATPKNPETQAIRNCRPRLEKVIATLQPITIILLGDIPFDSLIYPRLVGRLNGTPWTAFVGKIIPDAYYKTNLAVIWHPSYMLETKEYADGNDSPKLYERDPAIFTAWKKSIVSAMDASPYLTTNYLSEQIVITDENEAIDLLERACGWNIAAFDYETTGIKPYDDGHAIVYMSLSDGMFGYSFPFFKSNAFLDAVRKFLTSPCKKIAHNLQFEAIWSKQILGVWPTNWYWDTMVAAHCLDNKRPVGLKYLVYTMFGQIGYDDAIDKYLQSDPNDKLQCGDNAKNRIAEADPGACLLYNALDSFYTYKIYEQQKYDFTEFTKQGYDFFIETSQAFAKMSYHGISIDTDKLQSIETSLSEKMQMLDQQIMNSDAVKKWDKSEPFNFSSSKQLGHLLFGIMKEKPVAFTNGGAASVDKDALHKYDVPVVKDILEYRRIAKIRDTYIGQYTREKNGDKIHAFFYNTRVDTFRSSGGSPNLMQAPKRDKEAKFYTRSYIVPSKGNRIIEHDHGQLEVRINACYSGDKNLIKFIEEGIDMHTLSTMEAFDLKKEEVKKEYRNIIKGQFVFAEFYGSYYPQIAKDLWESAKEYPELFSHLKDRGLTTYKKFENKIKEAERIFWEERFPQHSAWRKDMHKFYQKHGYIEAYTGFRLYGPMQRNNTFNGQVQGTAYHVLQQGLNWAQSEIERKLEKTHIFAEIHDAIVADVDPAEEDWYDRIIWKNCTQKVRDKFEWIIVPLVMEKERSAINGNWAEMESCGILRGNV